MRIEHPAGVRDADRDHVARPVRVAPPVDARDVDLDRSVGAHRAGGELRRRAARIPRAGGPVALVDDPDDVAVLIEASAERHRERRTEARAEGLEHDRDARRAARPSAFGLRTVVGATRREEREEERAREERRTECHGGNWATKPALAPAARAIVVSELLLAEPAPAPDPPSPIAAGDLVDGKYRVVRELGQGAMGIVVLARHEALDVEVAIKVVTAHGIEAGEAAQRFLREARAAAKLESEHVVRVTDLGRLPSGAPYMVMELLRGTDLAALVARTGPLPVSETIDCVIEVLEAVAEAHAAGIVHRDLKPSNLFRADRASGVVMKVLDFGISKAADAAGVSLTKTHSMMGSPAYMSPEQILATKAVDARADIWSMGVVLYELLSGGPPFDGEQMGTILTSVLTSPIPSLDAARPDLPPGLAAIVHRCLERDLDRRWSSAAELAEALAPYASTAGAILATRIVKHVGGTGTVRIPGLPPARPAERTAVHDDDDAVRTVVAGPASRALRAIEPASDRPPVPVDSPRGVPIAVTIAVVAVALAAGYFARGALF